MVVNRRPANISTAMADGSRVLVTERGDVFSFF